MKASKGFVSSPLVSTDVMDPEDDPIDSIKKKNEHDEESMRDSLPACLLPVTACLLTA